MNKRIQSLEAEVAKSKTEDNSSLITVEDLRETNERVEERTNRQLRKTLVFRGIPEQEQEKSWKETENILAKRIADTLDIEIEDAATMIDRCHRGGNPKYYNDKNKPRPIFAAMFKWKDCEEIIWEARQKKSVLVDYKYGPLTTRRRNLALQLRRTLINEGTIVKAHVAYPARLMGKSATDKKYREIKDFSKTDVSHLFK